MTGFYKRLVPLEPEPVDADGIFDEARREVTPPWNAV
jgi:hypothetical protein